MSVSAAQLRALAALGIGGDQLLAVVDVMEMRDGRDVTERDERHAGPMSGAERSRRYRMRKEAERIKKYHRRKRNQENAEANDAAQSIVTPERDAVTSHCDDAPNLLSSLSLNLEGSSEEGRKHRKKVGTEIARARGQRMVAGAVLTDEFRLAAITLGAEPARVPEMWAEFVDYWIAIPGARGLKTDWPATWRNRVRNVLERGPQNGRAKPQSLSERASVLAEQARSAERAAGIVRPDDPFRGH